MNSSPNHKPLKRNPLSPYSADALYRCSFFLSTPFEGQAASRGLSVNDLLVQFFTPGAPPITVPLELTKPFAWGSKMTGDFAKGHPILVNRNDCRIRIPGVTRPGYCDCVIPGTLCSIDWKTGRRRPYDRQNAFYALGQMTERFAVEWTTATLYLDEEESEFHRFTLEEASEIVLQSRLKYDLPEAPQINESCNWCANFFECPRQLEIAAQALQIAEGALEWPAIIEDPERLGKFLLGVASLKEFDKEARTKAREFFFQKVEVPGFRLSNGKRSWSLPVESLLYLLNCGDRDRQIQAFRKAVEIFGAMSKEQYFRLCAETGIEPDETLLKVSRSDPFIVKKN